MGTRRGPYHTVAKFGLSRNSEMSQTALTMYVSQLWDFRNHHTTHEVITFSYGGSMNDLMKRRLRKLSRDDSGSMNRNRLALPHETRTRNKRTISKVPGVSSSDFRGFAA
jgi:hypothetical protein